MSNRTVVEDIDEYGMPPDIYKHLEELREQARVQESDAKAVQWRVACNSG